MSSEPILGRLIEGDVERDAIHIAIVPLIAGGTLMRGGRFRLKFGTDNVALDGSYNK